MNRLVYFSLPPSSFLSLTFFGQWRGDDTHHIRLCRHLIAEECISDWGYEPLRQEIFLFSKLIGAIWWLLSVKLLIKMNIYHWIMWQGFKLRKHVFIPHTVKPLGGYYNGPSSLSNIGGYIPPFPRVLPLWIMGLHMCRACVVCIFTLGLSLVMMSHFFVTIKMGQFSINGH